MAKVFTTTEDEQVLVNIHVVQGDAEKASDNVSLGRFTLADIPPAPAGNPRVRVTFQMSGEPDGRVHPLAVALRGSEARVTTARWAGTSTPERVAEGILRRTLRTLAPPELDEIRFEASVRPVADGRGLGRLTVRSIGETEWQGARRVRVSWAHGTPDRPLVVRHAVLTVGSEWSHSDLFPVAEGATLVAVLAEDLATARRGLRLVEPRF